MTIAKSLPLDRRRALSRRSPACGLPLRLPRHVGGIGGIRVLAGRTVQCVAGVRQLTGVVEWSHADLGK